MGLFNKLFKKNDKGASKTVSAQQTMDKEKFYEMVKNYIESGVIKEVFCSEEICVFNFSNLYYVVCPLDIATDQGHPFGLITNAQNALEIAKDHVKLYYTLRSFSTEYWQKGTLNLSDSNSEYIKELIEINKDIIPSKFIDYKIEKELRAMSKECLRD